MNNLALHLMYAAVIMLGASTFGAIVVYPSPAAAGILAEHGLESSDLVWSFYNSVSSLFAISGPFVTHGLLRLYGNSRKKAVFSISSSGAVFWAMNCLTKYNIWAGVCARAMLGIVAGAFSAVTPMYLVEIAPIGHSGLFGSLSEIGICIGMIFFDFIAPNAGYMGLNGLGAAICILQSILVWFIIESPAVINRPVLEGKEMEVDDDLKESICEKHNLKGAFVGFFIMFFQQFCGMNAILTNLVELMNKSGLKIDGNYQAGIASFAQFMATFVSCAMLDRFGRKFCWSVSNTILIISLLVYAFNEKYSWSNVIPLIAVFWFPIRLWTWNGTNSLVHHS